MDGARGVIPPDSCWDDYAVLEASEDIEDVAGLPVVVNKRRSMFRCFVFRASKDEISLGFFYSFYMKNSWFRRCKIHSLSNQWMFKPQMDQMDNLN